MPARSRLRRIRKADAVTSRTSSNESHSRERCSKPPGPSLCANSHPLGVTTVVPKAHELRENREPPERNAAGQRQHGLDSHSVAVHRQCSLARRQCDTPPLHQAFDAHWLAEPASVRTHLLGNNAADAFHLRRHLAVLADASAPAAHAFATRVPANQTPHLLRECLCTLALHSRATRRTAKRVGLARNNRIQVEASCTFGCSVSFDGFWVRVS